MSFLKYVCTKGIVLCCEGLFALFLFSILTVLDADLSFILIVEGLFFSIIIFWLIVSYLIFNSRVKHINNLIKQLDQKYLIGEILPRPVNELEAIYFEIMKQISYSAVDAVERETIEKEQYCEFVENWIHEMKTPLTACSLILDNADDQKISNSSNQAMFQSKLRRELKCADNLTENILYYARLKNAANDTIIREFRVMDIIEDAIKSQMSILIAAKISIETIGDFCVNSDDKALGYMVKQLLINSVKYCPGCHIVIKAEKGAITYKDDGIGIPLYDLKRVTQRGFTGDNGRKYGTSTGMGLYIVNCLCTQLGIDLEIDSKQNEYTIFCFKYSNHIDED